MFCYTCTICFTDTVNCCEVFKNHHGDLFSAIVDSCSLSNVAYGLSSVNLISQPIVEDALSATRPQDVKLSVMKILKEFQTFLDTAAKRDPSRPNKMLEDFCEVLQKQDSPMLMFISTNIRKIFVPS